jgi:hypothetical protein
LLFDLSNRSESSAVRWLPWPWPHQPEQAFGCAWTSANRGAQIKMSFHYYLKEIFMYAFHLGREEAGPWNQGRLIGQKLLLERFRPDWLVDTGQLGPALRPAGSGADCRTGLSSMFRQ